jgi:hypothetical protein
MVHHRLKAILLVRYGKLYVAAQDLGVRADKLSAYLWGRVELDEGILCLLERKLHLGRDQFIDSVDLSYDSLKK